LALAGTAGTATTASHAAAATAAARPGAVAPVTLITGDQLIPRSGKTAAVRHAVPSGPGGSFRSLSAGTHRYAFPASAGPYLGRVLDPALFDLNSLTPAGALKVHLTYRSGTSNHDVPGVTVTKQTTGGADGYLTPESAKRFGAALASQYIADQRTRDFGGHGVFAGVSAIRPASVPTPPVTPHYPMYTLSLTVLDQTGQPTPSGVVGVVNVDDGRKFGTIGGAFQGVAKFSVPAGHYVVVTEADVYDETANQLKSWLATLPQVTVTGNQSLTVDARLATSPVTAQPPAGTHLDDLIVGYQRDDAAGQGGLSWLMLGFPGDQFWVSPTAPVTVGSLDYFTEWYFSGASTAYTAVYPTGGQIPADQNYQVNPADMATIDTGYASDRPDAHVMVLQAAFPPNIGFLFVPALSAPAPARRTEYVTGGHGIEWQKEVALDGDNFGGVLNGSWNTYQAGEHRTENWGLPLRHPQYDVDTGVEAYFVPAATRRGDSVLLNLYAFGDDTRGHFGGSDYQGLPGLDDERVAWGLYAGDQRVAGADGDPYAAVTVPADPANYRLVLDADRSAAWWRLSTRTHTEWRFASAHQSGGSLPDRWHCEYSVAGPTDCAVLPLLMPDYSVAGIGLDGHAPAGPSTLDLAVAPVQGATPSPVTSVTVEVSYNSGLSWTPATVTGSGDHFTATCTTPDPAGTDGYVSVRTTATDAAGDAVTQTLTRAYALGS
jgi:hypothetical protein